jgi:hypothetical protein
MVERAPTLERMEAQSRTHSLMKYHERVITN